MKHVHFQNGTSTMAGDLYLPQDFNESKKYPAIVFVHPAGGVKKRRSSNIAE